MIRTIRHSVSGLALLAVLTLASSKNSDAAKAGAKAANPPAHKMGAVSSKPSAAQPEKLVLPTADDKKLLAQFDALVKAVDMPGAPAREVVNNTRMEWVAAMFRVLGSSKPVAPAALAAARGYIQSMMPQLAAARDLTAPLPSRIVQRRGELKIDGRFDEAEWQRAVAIPIQFDGVKAVAAPLATARLLWDDKFLYAAFDVPDTNIIAPDLVRDGAIWSYDCAEIFMVPDPRFGTYWELNVSPTGSLLDILLYKYQAQWGDDARPGETMEGLQIGRAVRGTPNQAGDRDDGYSIEMAIPFDQMPGLARGAVAGDSIHLMLARVNRDSAAANAPTAYIGHVPYVAWLHNIWAYQPFILAADSQAADNQKSTPQ